MEVHHHPHVDSDSHRKKNFKEYIGYTTYSVNQQ
jgi:hypothetical protein